MGSYLEKLCGIIALESENNEGGEFTWGHTTASMAVGFMSAGQRTPQVGIV